MLLAIEARAQQPELKFEKLTIADGLSENYVTSIVQDRQGFIWMGTQAGLNRYDGYGFTVYSHRLKDPAALVNNFINTLYVDSSGQLWVGTGDGLSRFDAATQRFTSYRNDNSGAPGTISNNVVNAIYEDSAGTLWVGTNQGLNILDRATGQFSAVRHQPGSSRSISNDTITAIIEDRSGVLWVGTADGLYRHDRAHHTFTVYRHNDTDSKSISNDHVTALFIDGGGALWVGTQLGLNRFDDKRSEFKSYRFNNHLPESNSSNIKTINEDNSGRIWAGTMGGGLYLLDVNSGRFQSIIADESDPQSIIANIILAIYRDRANILWVGTSGAGVCRYDEQSHRFITIRNSPNRPNGLSNNIIRSFHQDPTGVLWIATETGGINRFDPATGRFTVYRHDRNNPDSISSNSIGMIYRDRGGRIWLCTPDGLNRFDEQAKRARVYRPDRQQPDSINASVPTAVLEDRKGRLWVGTLGGGLNQYLHDRDGFRNFRDRPDNPESLTSGIILCIYEDRDGMIWLGGTGLAKFDPDNEKFTRFVNDPGKANSISTDLIRSICQDGNGNMWFGTYGLGVNKYEPGTGRFTHYTDREGLPDNNVIGLLEDNDGNIWMSTFKGLSRFDPRTGRFRNYDLQDGLQSNEFNTGAYLKGKDGELYFGGINGYNVIYPDRIKDNDYVPPIAITAFKIFDKLADAERLGIAQLAGLTDNASLELSYRENFFSFEFAALNYTLSAKNQYAYRLEGFDDNWINAGTRRYVSYTNLDAGEYIFRVKGSNNDGVWNERGIAIKIRIVPPLWRTWWAYICYFAGLVSLAYGGHRYRLNVIERDNKIKIATEIEKKNRELEIKNNELADKNAELIASQQRADRIFSALAEALPGTVLDGKYRLDEKIGAGGFGAVFRATHLGLQRPIAVKVFRPISGNDSAEALERFKLEAVNACRINHPNAVAVLDSGISQEGIAYLVMELLEGQALSKELQTKGRLTVRRCAQIVIPICSALSKAHSAGIVHRDIKPENIFLHRTPEGETVKVVDFGIAKLMGGNDGKDNKDLTGTGKLVGTPAYMAPERFEDKPYDGRADIYSLGVMLYEMLTGTLPFTMDEGGLGAIILMHLTKQPPSVKQVDANIPDQIDEIVRRSMAKDPAQRPEAAQLAEEFAAALDIELSLSPGNIKIAKEAMERMEIETVRIKQHSQMIESSTNEVTMQINPRDTEKTEKNS